MDQEKEREREVEKRCLEVESAACVCVCVCVCDKACGVRERVSEREREKGNQQDHPRCVLGLALNPAVNPRPTHPLTLPIIPPI